MKVLDTLSGWLNLSEKNVLLAFNHKKQLLTLIARVWMAATTLREPPKMRLLVEVESYSQMAVAVSTAVIFVICFITSMLPRLTMCARQLLADFKYGNKTTQREKEAHTVIVVHRYSSQGPGGCGWSQWFCRSCCCFQCYLVLPCTAKHMNMKREWESWDWILNRSSLLTLDSLLFIIPTRSSSPTTYLPRFSLL